MGEFEEARGPGKTTPRLIQDLLDYDPRRSRPDKRNVLTDPAPIYRKNVPYPLRSLPQDCSHKLIRIDGQSVISQGEGKPTLDSRYISVSYCEKCLYHFEIIVDYSQKPGKHTPCDLMSTFPLHHLQHLRSRFRQDHDLQKSSDKYDNYREAHRFACSAPDCPAIVEIRISPPRLSDERLSCVLDQAKTYQRGKRAIEADPARYTSSGPLQPLEILTVLRTYLVDAVNKPPTETKRIAVRNKKFLLAFGNECDDLFKYLEFVPHREEASQEEGQDPKGPENFWILPTVTPLNEVQGRKTNRHFLEDVICELSQRIADRPGEEKAAIAPSRVNYQPLPAWRDVRRVLGCDDYPTASRTVNLEQVEHPHYAGLGSVSDFDDRLIGFSYERQRECDPSNRPYYLECLQGIANGRESADLQEEVVKAVSLGENTLNDIEEAYKFFAIDPSIHHGDEYIIGVYSSRVESAPRQKEEARRCLLTIGKALSSEKIQSVANDKTMTLDEALEFLGVTSDTSSEYIEAIAVAVGMDADKAKVARALRVIANQRNELSLQVAASNMESGTLGSSLSVNEAYRRLQITDANTPDEMVLTYFQTLSANAPPGSKDSYTEALQVIARARGSSYLWTKLSDPNAVVATPRGSPDQPVGLDNIGNTCYLNSLLQYYYTVRPVRDVVMSFDDFRMPINTENILKKRVGGRRVDKGEILKAQKFVEELRHLFQDLKTAPSQSVKPTQELAELTLLSTATEANFRRASISSPTGIPATNSTIERPMFGPELPQPPAPDAPLPPIPSQPSPELSSRDEDIEMTDRPRESIELDDASSDTTLVDLDGSSDHFRKPTKTTDSPNQAYQNGQAHVPSQTTPTDALEDVSEAGLDSGRPQGTTIANGSMLTPPPDDDVAIVDAPPPVPPRNKPAPITTSGESDDAIRAQKLYFGAQQDVTEVIGNVMFRLQCAIKPESIDPKFGEQIDSIRETFYGANAVYLKKGNTYAVKVEDWANIIVFPASDGPRDIYEALDVVFDEQEVEFDEKGAKAITSQYASINKLPPVLQIQIQRTAFDPVTMQASKNQNRLVFEETIYLDRYMDSERVLQRRKEAWKWKDRLRKLEARQKALQNTKANVSIVDALDASKDFLHSLQEEEVEGIDIDGSLCEVLEDRAAEIRQEIDNIADEIARIKQKMQDQFTDMREHRYRLQAVFMHRGTNAYGHYWIYIYDFPHDVWREYNDERVSVVQDRKRIFEQDNPHSATPYYLVYVKDENKDNLVDAVFREMEESPNSTENEIVDVDNDAIDMDYSADSLGQQNPPEDSSEIPRSWDVGIHNHDKRVHW